MDVLFSGRSCRYEKRQDPVKGRGVLTFLIFGFSTFLSIAAKHVVVKRHFLPK